MGMRVFVGGRPSRRLAGAALGFAILAAAPEHHSWGEEAAAQSMSRCRFEPAATGKVAKILDGRDFVLDDGREIRLAGIEVPPAPRPGENGDHDRAGAAAAATLERIIADRPVQIGRGVPDRYGRIVAYVNVIAEEAPRPVNQAMVATGSARVSVLADTSGCAVELLEAERMARAARLGLWANPYYAIVGAESGVALLAERGHFTIVEGKVVSVRESGSNIYVNFGRRWSEALTVTISKRNERMFAAAGLAPKTLERRRLRVRGWIEERNGPRIEATRPEQIEIAERN
jgi:endonuclease YncB( thermonuclease family)